MSNKIYMYWFKLKNDEKNFGDELGPFIVRELSGQQVVYVPSLQTPIKYIQLGLKRVISGIESIGDFKIRLGRVVKKDVLISIGSVINHYKGGYPTIWGAGIISRKDDIQPGNFLAVRGKYTQVRLNELGYKVPSVIGDPAILLPLLLKPNSQKKYKIGVIPHHIHFKEVTAIFKNSDVLVINLLDDIEEVVQNITLCEQTISSSLHGIIVSHAYNIPSLWYKLSDKELAGDNIKFKDYFSSVEIKEYQPFKLNYHDSELRVKISNTIQGHQNISLPIKKISEMQIALLRAAPFPLQDKYKECYS